MELGLFQGIHTEIVRIYNNSYSHAIQGPGGLRKLRET